MIEETQASTEGRGDDDPLRSWDCMCLLSLQRSRASPAKLFNLACESIFSYLGGTDRAGFEDGQSAGGEELPRCKLHFCLIVPFSRA